MSTGSNSGGAGPSAGSVGAPSPVGGLGGGSVVGGGGGGGGGVGSVGLVGAGGNGVGGSVSVGVGSGGGGGGSGGGGGVASGAASPCCDSGRPLVTDPVTGQTVCSCQYDRLQALSAYGPSAAAAAAARLAAVSSAVTGVTGLHGVYSAAYGSSDQNPYPSLGMDSTTAFYSSLVSRHRVAVAILFLLLLLLLLLLGFSYSSLASPDRVAVAILSLVLLLLHLVGNLWHLEAIALCRPRTYWAPAAAVVASIQYDDDIGQSLSRFFILRRPFRGVFVFSAVRSRSRPSGRTGPTNFCCCCCCCCFAFYSHQRRPSLNPSSSFRTGLY